MPIAPLVASHLEFSRCIPVGEEVEEEGKGNGRVYFRERALAGSFVLSLYLSFAGGNLRGGLRREFQQNIHQFSGCAPPGPWSPLIDWSMAG